MDFIEGVSFICIQDLLLALEQLIFHRNSFLFLDPLLQLAYLL